MTYLEQVVKEIHDKGYELCGIPRKAQIYRDIDRSYFLGNYIKVVDRKHDIEYIYSIFISDISNLPLFHNGFGVFKKNLPNVLWYVQKEDRLKFLNGFYV